MQGQVDTYTRISMSRSWSNTRPVFDATLIAVLALYAPTQTRADGPKTFYRCINLNGPALVIDGQKWDGGDAPDVACDDAAFEGQSVPLNPPLGDDDAATGAGSAQ
jgi:hypothetical protein